MNKYTLSLIFSSLIGLSACQSNNELPEATNEPMRIHVVSPSHSNTQPTLSLTGTVTAREDVAIGTALTGQKIVAVLAEVGQTVKKGQVLARLDSVNVQSQLQQNQMALAKAQANLTARQSEFKEANATFARYQQLVNVDAVSRQEFDQQRLKTETAQANIQTAQSEIAQIESQIMDSKHQRSKADIIAPVDGIISQRTAETGALAGTDALFHVIKNDEMQLSANANANELSLLRAGMPAQVSINGNETTLTGKIRVVSPQMDTVTRLGKVLIAFDNSVNLPNGAYGKAMIQLPKRTVTMALPSQAVSFLDDGQAFVMTVDETNHIKRQIVQIKPPADGWVEIVSGIDAVQKVVKNATAFVSEGDEVTPVLDETSGGQ